MWYKYRVYTLIVFFVEFKKNLDFLYNKRLFPDI
jgi:hypothetical protein